MDTDREKVLRIKQITEDGMLETYDFENNEKTEIVDYIVENRAKMRELSLRTVLKLADLRKMSAGTWKKIAEVTIIRKGVEA